eukprot:1771315-Prymnesium_polylepis.1
MCIRDRAQATKWHIGIGRALQAVFASMPGCHVQGGGAACGLRSPYAAARSVRGGWNEGRSSAIRIQQCGHRQIRTLAGTSNARETWQGSEESFSDTVRSVWPVGLC